VKQHTEVPAFGWSDIKPRYRHPIDQFDQLNVLKEKLTSAFDHRICWVVDNMFFGSPSSFTLVEFVPRKGVRRIFGHKQVTLARFERDTRFREGCLTVHDDRVRVHLETTAPMALAECAKALGRMNAVRVEIC
jgi:hypothetical protein